MPVTREQREQVLEMVERAIEHVPHFLFFRASVSHESWQKDLREILAHVYGDLHKRYSAKEQEYSEIAQLHARHEEFATVANKYRDLADSCRQMSNSYYIKAEYDEEVSSSPEMQNLAEFRESQIAENRDQIRELMQKSLDILRDGSVPEIELSQPHRDAETFRLFLDLRNTVSRDDFNDLHQSLAIAYAERILTVTTPARSQAPA